MKRVVLTFLTLALGQSAFAQSNQTGERLSDWLLRQRPSLEYPIGLAWHVPQERAVQIKLKQALLDSLQAMPQHAEKLKAWIDAQPVTGRAVLSSVDPRWLQAHPAQDPILAANQSLHMAARPTSVTVLLPDGSLCQAMHMTGATVKSYLDVCSKGDSSPKAWIAQPDGRVSSYGIAEWNAESQSELAPGAWIWAPGHKLEFTQAFSDGLIRFLGSLGAMADQSQLLRLDALKLTPDYLLRGNTTSASDWGEIGLIQTPSARMAEVGTMRLNLSKVLPYTHSNVMFQPTSWLEAGFRYTDIGNRAYDISGALQTGQTYKDKSFDFKLRLREESTLAPAVAVGMRDIGGTGLFSSEYLVASKRFGDLDASLGIGWGYMASSGNVSNPLGKLNSSFYTRPSTATVSGGEVGTKAMFRGPAGLFGGVQWRSSDSLTYKVEREANDYQNEPLNNNLARRSFWNFAANYRYSPTVELAVGWERGNKLMFGLSFQTNLDGQNVPKLLNPPSPKYQPAAQTTNRIASDFGQELFNQTGWDLMSIEERSGLLELHVRAGTGIGMHRKERMDRLNSLVQANAGQHIRRWSVIFIEKGLTVAALEVDRDAWIAKQTQAEPASLKKDVVTAYSPHEAASPKVTEKTPQTFKFGIGPSYNHILGGPDAFYLYRLGVAATGSYHFNPSTWVDGALDFRLLDNFEQFKYTAPSNLPRVRTYMREYQTTSRATIPLLQATHVASPAQNHFTSVYGGMLESMFMGVGGEWLYRPSQSTLAVGVDVNRVHQRDFKQNFALRDYQVNTGHATAYWDTGVSDVLLKLQVGQYLAGDRGVTVDMSRSFKNGVTIGAYATKTNVSAVQFGEGSFDKGVYLSLPFDVMLPKYSERSATIAWQPLTRDGGARLARANPLYNLTSGRDARAFRFESPQNHDVVKVRQDEQTFVTPIALEKELTAEPITTSVSRSVSYVGAQLTHSQSKEPWLWGAAAVLGASLLDKKADSWAVNHSSLTGVAKLGNAMPLFLGVGALATSMDDGVGVAALKAGGIALAANTVLRSAVGRSRPEEGLGSHNFSPFRATSLKSGFPSNHVAAAFALATPLAQYYDAPWLYGFASVTAIGRVQGRQHWLSDTVAGGVLGYAVGSVLTDEYKSRSANGSKKREFLASPSSVAVRWHW
jgi:membrane-associated phospholipid phosphatase